MQALRKNKTLTATGALHFEFVQGFVIQNLTSFATHSHAPACTLNQLYTKKLFPILFRIIWVDFAPNVAWVSKRGSILVNTFSRCADIKRGQQALLFLPVSATRFWGNYLASTYRLRDKRKIHGERNSWKDLQVKFLCDKIVMFVVSLVHKWATSSSLISMCDFHCALEAYNFR